jgi:glycosyltransferase involved in cell wall biosynthesis
MSAIPGDGVRPPLRIVYVDPHPVPDTCPEAMQILQTVDALAQIGCEVILATPAPAAGRRCEDVLGRAVHPRVTFHVLRDLRGKRWLPVRSGRFFYREACRFVAGLAAVDGLLVRNLKLAAALLAVPKRPPLVFETHEVFARTFSEDRPAIGWRDRRKLAALRRREGGVYAGSDGIAALTPWLLDDLREEYGVATPGVVVPDGVDLDAVAGVSAKPHWSNPPALLYLGSLHPWKGVDRLIAALPQVVDAHLVIAGGPPARIAELERSAVNFGVADRVSFCGSVPPEARFRVIADADICLLPLTDTSIASRYTSPLKLFEYMAVGKPIVAADVPALRGVLTDGRDGVLAPVDDTRQLAAAISRLLADPATAKAIGSAARARARDFSWTARARTLRDFFIEIAESQK